MPQIPWSTKEISIGQFAERSGVSVSALHFYEAKGLIRSRRTPGNQRRYAREELRRVAFIRAAQRLGIALGAIKEMLDQLPEERTPTRDDWARLSSSWQALLDERIQQMQRLRNALTECVGCGCLSMSRCTLVNPDDRDGLRGAGPQRLYPDRA
ncbi:redox-sensitive transcriptional activator SoxR [Nocardia sp. CNY236]|uniref:redox-sensitive transcriptional activator SoxR n=1 Tax=Nocardia sp. CNY236 TaxID=1169152 RepID=UPI00048B8D30|nr:redox-sensitive transcriptional activator SoxR [Nocardia sp. CNY236]